MNLISSTSTITEAQKPEASSSSAISKRVAIDPNQFSPEIRSLLKRNVVTSFNAQIFNFSNNANLNSCSPYYKVSELAKVIQFHRYNPVGDRPVFSVQGLPRELVSISDAQIKTWLEGEVSEFYTHYKKYGASINITIERVLTACRDGQKFLYRPHYAQYNTLENDNGVHKVRASYAIYPYGMTVSFARGFKNYEGLLHDQVVSLDTDHIAYKAGDENIGFICVTLHRDSNNKLLPRPVDIDYIALINTSDADDFTKATGTASNFLEFLKKFQDFSTDIQPLRETKKLLRLSNDQPLRVIKKLLRLSNELTPGMLIDNSEDIYFKHASVSEKTHRWNYGLDWQKDSKAIEKEEIIFSIQDPNVFEGKLIINGFIFPNPENEGKQVIIIKLNGKEISFAEHQGTSFTKKVFEFDKKLMQVGENQLMFEFPHACQPGNGDLRKVGLSIESFSIN